MPKTMVMTVIGKDRTGLVESLARLIEDNGGNWIESRMCRLGGEFAGILRILLPKEREPALVKALRDLDSEGLTVIAHPDEVPPPAGETRKALLSMTGHDRPGIIRQISAALANQDINVEELESECFCAPMSGEILFQALARLRVPGSRKMSEIRRELEKLGSELMVDISFTED
jgi:glycine cleavage system regulatory protein